MTTLVALTAIVGLFGSGCASKQKQTGFLSDYSQLQKDSGDLRYFNAARVANYKQFIVEPVHFVFYKKDTAKKLDAATKRRMAKLMHDEIVRELSGRYKIVSEPGPGVAVVRVAITDLRKDTPALNVLPQTRMTGLGLGGVSMEGELLDSRTRKQIAAVVQAGDGGKISLEGLSKWSSAEAVIKKWAKKFGSRIDKAHDGG